MELLQIMDDYYRYLDHQLNDALRGDLGFNNLAGSEPYVLPREALVEAFEMIRDSAILLLDEFTSVMDRKVEEEILEDLFALSHGRTLICVTRSAAAASRFDRVISLDAQLSPCTAVL